MCRLFFATVKKCPENKFFRAFFFIVGRNLFFPLNLFHRFYGYNNNLVPAFRTNVSFATGATEAVAARTIQLFLIPGFSAMGAGNVCTFLLHTYSV
jgi:hypothetical protein